MTNKLREALFRCREEFCWHGNTGKALAPAQYGTLVDMIDAALDAVPEEPLLKPLAQAALDLSDALHRYEVSGAPSLPVYIDNAWGNLTVILEQCRPQNDVGGKHGE